MNGRLLIFLLLFTISLGTVSAQLVELVATGHPLADWYRYLFFNQKADKVRQHNIVSWEEYEDYGEVLGKRLNYRSIFDSLGRLQTFVGMVGDKEVSWSVDYFYSKNNMRPWKLEVLWSDSTKDSNVTLLKYDRRGRLRKSKLKVLLDQPSFVKCRLRYFKSGFPKSVSYKQVSLDGRFPPSVNKVRFTQSKSGNETVLTQSNGIDSLLYFYKFDAEGRLRYAFTQNGVYNVTVQEDSLIQIESERYASITVHSLRFDSRGLPYERTSTSQHGFLSRIVYVYK